MPFLKTLPEDAGPPNLFARYPEIYGPWSTMSQALMNGPSPLSPGERELILAYAAAVADCSFVSVAHAAVAYAWGFQEGLLEQLLENVEAAPVEERLKPLLVFIRKLTLSPGDLSQQDADAVFEAGWNEQALHDAVAVAARAAFMQRLVQGHGFQPPSPEVAAKHAKRRVERGYVNLYRVFREPESGR
jgi:uncharacterized peroxidase-related enzyme